MKHEKKKQTETSTDESVAATAEATPATDALAAEEESGQTAGPDIKNEWESKYNELNDSHLRLMAEFDNYRKRTLREKADLIKSAGESILVNLLPLVDDFERGLQSIDKSDDVAAVRQGVELIYNKFAAFLQQNGVKAVDTDGKDFDTEFHEAITTIPSQSDDQKGKIIDCIQKGYTLNDKVIRFAKVVVAG
jgi:molecular chaperone GrpE